MTETERRDLRPFLLSSFHSLKSEPSSDRSDVWRNAPFVMPQKYSVRHHFVQMADQHPLRHLWYASPQLASTHGPIQQSP